LADAARPVELQAKKEKSPEPDIYIDPVDLVDPHIGDICHLLISMALEVQLPHGFAVIAPVIEEDVTDTAPPETTG
jgi:hypothetical protein